MGFADAMILINKFEILKEISSSMHACRAYKFGIHESRPNSVGYRSTYPKTKIQYMLLGQLLKPIYQGVPSVPLLERHKGP